MRREGIGNAVRGGMSRSLRVAMAPLPLSASGIRTSPAVLQPGDARRRLRWRCRGPRSANETSSPSPTAKWSMRRARADSAGMSPPCSAAKGRGPEAFHCPSGPRLHSRPTPPRCGVRGGPAARAPAADSRPARRLQRVGRNGAEGAGPAAEQKRAGSVSWRAIRWIWRWRCGVSRGPPNRARYAEWRRRAV